MADVTREELKELRDDLVSRMNDQMSRMTSGFTGTHARLDMINGRVGKGEVAMGVMDARMGNLERETFRSPGRRLDRDSSDLASTPITFGSLDWLVKFGGWIVAAILAFLKLTGKL